MSKSLVIVKVQTLNWIVDIGKTERVASVRMEMKWAFLRYDSFLFGVTGIGGEVDTKPAGQTNTQEKRILSVGVRITSPTVWAGSLGARGKKKSNTYSDSCQKTTARGALSMCDSFCHLCHPPVYYFFVSSNPKWCPINFCIFSVCVVLISGFLK